MSRIVAEPERRAVAARPGTTGRHARRLADLTARLGLVAATVWIGGWSAARLGRFLQDPAPASRRASPRPAAGPDGSPTHLSPLGVEGTWSVAGLPWRVRLAGAVGDDEARRYAAFAEGRPAPGGDPVEMAGLVRLVTLFGRKEDLGGGEERWAIDRANYRVGALMRRRGGRRRIAALRVAWRSGPGWSLLDATARGPGGPSLATGPGLPSLPSRARVVCVGWDRDDRAACAVAQFPGGLRELVGRWAREGWEPSLPRADARRADASAGLVCRRAGEVVRIWSRPGPEAPGMLIVGMLRLAPEASIPSRDGEGGPGWPGR